MKFKHQKLLISAGSVGVVISPAQVFNTLASVLSRELNFLARFINPAAKIHAPLEQSLQLVKRAMPIEISLTTQLQQADLVVLLKCFTHNVLYTCGDEMSNFYF